MRYFSLSVLPGIVPELWKGKMEQLSAHQLSQVLQTYCLTKQKPSSVGCIPPRCHLCLPSWQRPWIHLQDDSSRVRTCSEFITRLRTPHLVSKTSLPNYPATDQPPAKGTLPVRNALPQVLGKGIAQVWDAGVKTRALAVATDKQHLHHVKAQQSSRSPFPGNVELF